MTEVFFFLFPEPNDFRLVGGTSRCRGTLEINAVGEWEPTDTLNWNLRLAGRVCGKLDCGSVISVRTQTSLSNGRRLSMTYNCTESSLLKCFVKHSYSNSKLEISCSGKTNIFITQLHWLSNGFSKSLHILLWNVFWLSYEFFLPSIISVIFVVWC